MTATADQISEFTTAVRRTARVSPALGWSLIASATAALMWTTFGSMILMEPDMLWHIATGQWIVANGRWPRTDVFSYTFAGQPWIAKEWLSQVMLYAAYSANGWPGVVILTAAAAASTLLIIMRYCGREVGAVGGMAMGLVAFQAIALSTVARPHVLAYPIIAMWTVALLSRPKNNRPPWIAIPIMVLWTNMHAGFTAGYIIAAGIGLEAVVRAGSAERIRVIAHWFLFGIACLVASICNPNGTQSLLINANVAGGVESMREIHEWGMLKLDASTGILLLFAALGVIALSQRWKENAARILLLLVLTTIMIRHRRFVTLFGIVAPLLAGPAVFQMLDTMRRRLELFRNFSLPKTDHLARIAIAIIALAIAVPNVRMPTPAAEYSPAAALASVPEDLRRQRVFNSYNIGGFLISRGIKTFIDGRSDQLFLGGFMAGMSAAARADGPDLLAGLLDTHKVAWAIVSADFPEATQFTKLTGWRRTYADKYAHVWVRDAATRN